MEGITFQTAKGLTKSWRVHGVAPPDVARKDHIGTHINFDVTTCRITGLDHFGNIVIRAAPGPGLAVTCSFDDLAAGATADVIFDGSAWDTAVAAAPADLAELVETWVIDQIDFSAGTITWGTAPVESPLGMFPHTYGTYTEMGKVYNGQEFGMGSRSGLPLETLHTLSTASITAASTATIPFTVSTPSARLAVGYTQGSGSTDWKITEIVGGLELDGANTNRVTTGAQVFTAPLTEGTYKLKLTANTGDITNVTVTLAEYNI